MAESDCICLVDFLNRFRLVSAKQNNFSTLALNLGGILAVVFRTYEFIMEMRYYCIMEEE